MLRHAEEKDKAALLGYLCREPEFNLFIIGDILQFGLHSETIDVYVEDGHSQPESVLMRYRNNFIPYTHLPEHDLSAVAERITDSLKKPGIWFISGKKEVVDRLKPKLSRKPAWERDQFFSVCREMRTDIPLTQLTNVRVAEPEDAPEVLAVWDAAFGEGKQRPPLDEDIEQGRTRVVYVRSHESHDMVSTAAAVAESDAAAMIIGVATRPEHRRRGYGSACVYRLVTDLHHKDKSACLFFHNPAAGTIYHKLGFADIGMWKMMRYEKRAR
jgi:uncharacterized protein